MATPEPKPVPEHLRRFDVVRALVYFEEHDGRRKERPMVVIRLSGDGEALASNAPVIRRGAIKSVARFYQSMA